ncbi:MAG: hypothetical protein JXR76_17100 [Deltaproteobacteria bacterium]|nr:hypothetical protein [Deltaproteobacteria bacterium]
MRSFAFFLSLFLVHWGVAIPARGATPAVPVIFSLCTDLSATDVTHFVDDVNAQMSVTQLSIVLSCTDQPLLYSGNGMLAMHLSKNADKLYMQVQPTSGSGTANNVTARRREVTWTTDESKFIEATRERGKVTTFALLLDNMVLDYATIPILPAQPVAGKFSVADGQQVPSDEDSLQSAERMPGFKNLDEQNNDARNENTGMNSDGFVDTENDENCEKRLTHILMSMSTEELTKENCIQRFDYKDKKLTVFTGVSAGLEMFTPGSRALQLSTTFALYRNHFGLVIRGTLEGDSNFIIEKIPFDTWGGSLALGPGGFMKWKRLEFSLQSLVDFRYWEVKRADISATTMLMYTEIGAGLFLLLAMEFTRYFGMYATAGATVFPRARHIVLEGGGKNRLGLFHFPFNIGAFLRF